MIKESWLSRNLMRKYPFEDGTTLPDNLCVDARFTVPEQLAGSRLYLKECVISSFYAKFVIGARGYKNPENQDIIGTAEIYNPKIFQTISLVPVVPYVSGSITLGTFLPENNTVTFSDTIHPNNFLGCLVEDRAAMNTQKLWFNDTIFSKNLKLLASQGIIIEKSPVYLGSLDKPKEAFIFRVSRVQNLLSNIVHPCDKPQTEFADQGIAVSINNVMPDKDGIITFEIRSGKTFIPSYVNYNYEQPKPGEKTFLHIKLDSKKNPIYSNTNLLNVSYVKRGLVGFKDNQNYRVICEERNRINGLRVPSPLTEGLYGSAGCEKIKGEHIIVRGLLDENSMDVGIYLIGAYVWRNYLVIYWAVTVPGTVAFGSDGISGIEFNGRASIDGAVKLKQGSTRFAQALAKESGIGPPSSAGKPWYGVYKLSNPLNKFEQFSIRVTSKEAVVSIVQKPNGGVIIYKNAVYTDSSLRYAMDPEDPKPVELE